MTGNQIRDVKPVAALGELHFLLLQDNQIRDFDPLIQRLRQDATGPQRFAPYLELYVRGNPGASRASALKQYGVRLGD